MITAKTQEIPLRSAAQRIRLGGISGEIAEIRLRVGRRACAVTTDGRNIPCSERLTQEDINDCFQELCRCSVHSYSNEIAQGYITLSGGHRVGICGTAVMSGGRVETMQAISSLCIRLAREVRGCAQELYDRAFSDGLHSLLLIGKPMCGKTTVLRDLARILGENRRIVIIDSRGELSAAMRCAPQLDVGENTDVLAGFPKREGIMTALRALSPEVIICDEIGDDAQAVRECLFCGVKLIASAHAASIDEAAKRSGIGELLPCFELAALLTGKGRLAELRETGCAR